MGVLSLSTMTIADYLLIIMTAICIFTDLKKQRIYNIILFPFVAMAFLLSLYNGGISQLLTSIKGMLLGMALLIIPFAMGGMGGGDVKLLGAIGALKGTIFVLSVFLTGAMAGGLISLVILLKTGRLKAILLPFLSRYYPGLMCFGAQSPRNPSSAFPYVLAIGSGVFLTYINVLHV